MRYFLILFVLGCCHKIKAQNKDYTPTKITTPPKLDGKPDDAVWQKINAVEEFVVSYPDFGKAPSRKTKVQIAYDNIAIYVLAIMYDEPKNIRKQLTQRDVIDRQDTDNFTIGLDTYQDRQNAFSFTVTAAGVQGDARQSSNNFDRSWDAVWMSAVSIVDYG